MAASNNPSRRAMLGSIAAIGTCPTIACAMPATTSQFRQAEAHYQAARHRFNNLPVNLEIDNPAAFVVEEHRHMTAVKAVDAALPQTWEEFANAFEIACDGGQSLPKEDLVMKLLDDVRRLALQGAR